jgi:hypothetical protein
MAPIERIESGAISAARRKKLAIATQVQVSPHTR